MSEAKKFNSAWLLAFAVPIILIIGIAVFLGSKDCDTCLTGWDTLKLEWPSFWTWAVIGIIIGVIALYLAYANESGSGAVGRKMNGSTGFTIFLLLIAIAFMAGPWGKACTDKANQGVTAPGYKNEQPAK